MFIHLRMDEYIMYQSNMYENVQIELYSIYASEVCKIGKIDMQHWVIYKRI